MSIWTTTGSDLTTHWWSRAIQRGRVLVAERRPPGLLTIAQVAGRLGLESHEVEYLIEIGHLQGIRDAADPARIWVGAGSLEAYRRRVDAGQPPEVAPTYLDTLGQADQEFLAALERRREERNHRWQAEEEAELQDLRAYTVGILRQRGFTEDQIRRWFFTRNGWLYGLSPEGALDAWEAGLVYAARVADPALLSEQFE
jgi:hypothetical protein